MVYFFIKEFWDYKLLNNFGEFMCGMVKRLFILWDFNDGIEGIG